MNSQRNYHLIADALHWLCENQQNQPGLEELAQQFGLSPQYLQRVFQNWVGVSPKQFLKYLTRDKAMERLRKGQSVLESAISSGLSGPGRLHDLLITTQAMTPGEAKKHGLGVKIQYGYGATPFGEAMLAWNKRGICFLGFCHEVGRQVTREHFSKQWPDAELSRDDLRASDKLAEIFNKKEHQQLKIWLRGSPFQLQVWEALLKLPAGTHCTYGQLASFSGHEGANQATGTAVGRNPVSWLIPCHRVINSLGALGGYRWGTNTKQAIIGYEAARNPD
jgi:AraC family transcriptional regulator of adaptative response/methylated-DNA-[protein]-cysteine methyltransferase